MNIFTKDEEQKIIEMYKNKVSIDDIINHFNSNERYIRIVLKNNAVDRVYNTFALSVLKSCQNSFPMR